MHLLLVFLWLSIIVSCKDSSLEVKTNSGRVRGHIVTTSHGQTVEAFLGIPYADSTGGRNRFSPPKYVEPWDGIFEAATYSSPCFQVVTKEQKQYHSTWVSNNQEAEDCLSLNIWVPNPRTSGKAVMVWIHGGGFAGGSTDVPTYNGAKLAAQEDVIVVTLNYRLSVFGFLYLDHPLAPGNVGLMDQALGLEWVKRNIQAFGGDPAKVTIFGQSAGGASVGYHVLLPSSLDLFQNAILQSGSPNGVWAYNEADDALKQSLLFAKAAGCPVEENNREETVRCLQDLDADKVLAASFTLEDRLLKMVFKPVVDGKYLPNSPPELLSQGKFCTEKKVMLGYTREDGSLLIPISVPHLTHLEKSQYQEHELDQLAAISINGESGLPFEVLKHVYSEWNSSTSKMSLTFDEILRLWTDRWFACPTTKFANQLASKGNSVYFYRFDHPFEAKESDVPMPSWLGAAHGHDLPILFGNVQGKDQERFSKQLMRFWSNFAKNGNPNDDYLPDWPVYTSEKRIWLQLAIPDITVNMSERQKECLFWENVFPKLEALSKNYV